MHQKLSMRQATMRRKMEIPCDEGLLNVRHKSVSAVELTIRTPDGAAGLRGHHIYGQCICRLCRATLAACGLLETDGPYIDAYDYTYSRELPSVATRPCHHHIKVAPDDAWETSRTAGCSKTNRGRRHLLAQTAAAAQTTTSALLTAIASAIGSVTRKVLAHEWQVLCKASVCLQAHDAWS